MSNEALMEARRIKALTENVNFYRWGRGNANKEMAEACLAAIDKELDELKPSAGVTYSEHCVYLEGARNMVKFIKGKIAKGETQAHENTVK